METKKKYMWMPVSLEQELKSIQDRIKQEAKVSINLSDIGGRLAEDLKNGNIKVEIPILRFNNEDFIKLRGRNVKIKRTR